MGGGGGGGLKSRTSRHALHSVTWPKTSWIFHQCTVYSKQISIKKMLKIEIFSSFLPICWICLLNSSTAELAAFALVTELSNFPLKKHSSKKYIYYSNGCKDENLVQKWTCVRHSLMLLHVLFSKFCLNCQTPKLNVSNVSIWRVCRIS